jgi:hypothetical protein
MSTRPARLPVHKPQHQPSSGLLRTTNDGEDDNSAAAARKCEPTPTGV